MDRPLCLILLLLDLDSSVLRLLCVNKTMNPLCVFWDLIFSNSFPVVELHLLSLDPCLSLEPCSEFEI